ncbi:site-specific integrase [Propionivibrio sp.]|uniref:tyrosine-type recombinase/integrase n=1 Tax=Propionivibrio sp. TaxID=2212460 RepID=UPI002609914A|nr:site-specific integrase [Propionivibrio sp.]
MQRRIRFTRKVIDGLPPCPPDHGGREIEYTSLEAPPGLRLVVNKRGAKSWLQRYTMPTGRGPGLKRAIKLGDYPSIDPAEACRIAMEHRANIGRGIDPLAVRQEFIAEPTLNEFFDEEYWPQQGRHLKSAACLETRWRLHIAPEFGNLRFSQLRPSDVMRFHNRNRERRCAATANRILALLKRVCNVAIMLERCDKNPCRGVRLHPEMNIRRRVLAGDELRRFIHECQQEKSRVTADFLMFALATAARREECLQAQWSEFSIDDRLWRIPAERAKSARSRLIPLNDFALNILKARREATTGDYVFPGKRGGYLVNPMKVFEQIKARAGIEDLHIHDLRRSAASLILNTGGGGTGGLVLAQNLLGHASSILTSTRYAFLADQNLIDASSRLGSALAGVSDGTTPSPAHSG